MGTNWRDNVTNASTRDLMGKSDPIKMRCFLLGGVAVHKKWNTVAIRYNVKQKLKMFD